MARFRKVATPLLLIMSVSPTLADEGASGLYVPGNFGFGAGVTPDPGLYLSTGIGYYDGDIKVYIEGGKILLDVDKRPFSTAFAALSISRRRSWVAGSDSRSAPPTVSHGLTEWLRD